MATLAAVQSSCAFASPTTLTKPSSGNSRPWRPLQPSIVQPAVGWTNGLGRSL